MRICIDSCVFINALHQTYPAATQLLNLISPNLILIVPRLVGQEVIRNLDTPQQVRLFYQLFRDCDFAFIIDEPVPRALVDKYVLLGIPEKADAFIGAFAEWMQVQYLISDNRHFLRDLQTDAFKVLDAVDFVTHLEQDTL